MVADELPATTVGLPGTPGAPLGITESELTLGEEVPSAFVAVALKV